MLKEPPIHSWGWNISDTEKLYIKLYKKAIRVESILTDKRCPGSVSTESGRINETVYFRIFLPYDNDGNPFTFAESYFNWLFGLYNIDCYGFKDIVFDEYSLDASGKSKYRGDEIIQLIDHQIKKFLGISNQKSTLIKGWKFDGVEHGYVNLYDDQLIFLIYDKCNGIHPFRQLIDTDTTVESYKKQIHHILKPVETCNFTLTSVHPDEIVKNSIDEVVDAIDKQILKYREEGYEMVKDDYVRQWSTEIDTSDRKANGKVILYHGRLVLKYENHEQTLIFKSALELPHIYGLDSYEKFLKEFISAARIDTVFEKRDLDSIVYMANKEMFRIKQGMDSTPNKESVELSSGVELSVNETGEVIATITDEQKLEDTIKADPEFNTFHYVNEERNIIITISHDDLIISMAPYNSHVHINAWFIRPDYMGNSCGNIAMIDTNRSQCCVTVEEELKRFVTESYQDKIFTDKNGFQVSYQYIIDYIEAHIRTFLEDKKIK